MGRSATLGALPGDTEPRNRLRRLRKLSTYRIQRLPNRPKKPSVLGTRGALRKPRFRTSHPRLGRDPRNVLEPRSSNCDGAATRGDGRGTRSHCSPRWIHGSSRPGSILRPNIPRAEHTPAPPAVSNVNRENIRPRRLATGGRTGLGYALESVEASTTSKARAAEPSECAPAQQGCDGMHASAPNVP